MAKKTEKNESKGAELLQVFLKVDCSKLGGKGSKAPMLVLRRASDESHTADLVKLDGVVVKSNEYFKDDEPWDEKDSWLICSKVADVCRAGNAAQIESPEHLAYAYSILCDYLKEFGGDYTMSKETAETLIRGAIDRIVCAGKCFGLRLDLYRSDD